MINKKIRNLNPVGKDSIIGGVFFGSGMTPSGIFKNIPRYDFKPEIEEKEAELMLTLNKVKHSINDNLKSQEVQIENIDELSVFLNEYIDLLIDYRDLRNYIFYGSANTEIAYQINNLINTFPYKTLISESYDSNDIVLRNYVIDGKNKTEIIFPYYQDNNRSDVRIISDNWNKFILDDTNENLKVKDLRVVDRNNKYYQVEEIITPYQNDSSNYIITNIANVNTVTSGHSHNSIKITTLQKLNLEDPNFIFDKIFVNGNLQNLVFSYNDKPFVINKHTFRVLKQISDHEFLIVRGNTNNIFENLKAEGINSSDTFGGIIKFNGETTIYELQNISNTTYNLRNLIGLNFVGGSINNIVYQTPTNYNIGDIISFFDAEKDNKNIELEYSVINSIYNDYTYVLNQYEQKFKIVDIKHIPSNINRLDDKYEIIIERADKIGINEEIQTSFIFDNINIKTRYSEIEKNGDRIWIKVVIDGYFSYENLISYIDSQDISKKGLIISPSKTIISLFDDSLTPLQKYLLSPKPINNIPWPRREITGNIKNIINNDFNPLYQQDYPDTEIDFYNWLVNPDLFHEYQFGELVEEIYSPNLFYEFQLIRAVYDDENYTNQLLRRAIPHEIINEIDDAEFYFGRFILTAGWFFDQIKIYVDFLKYAHTINYGQFNQLSPEFYKLYAEHYGFNLFEDEDIDFGKLIIQTEPGFYYSNDNTIEENKYFTKTLLQAQQERQKRLLINLFYLYSLKGTKICIEKLVSLIGAPEGLLTIKEYAFKVRNLDQYGLPTDTYNGDLIVDNEKIHIPEFKFEIDTDFLKDKVNINNPINKPYVYKKVYNNDYTHNLREISLDISVNDSIQKHIDTNYGEQLYNFVGLNEYEFTNLQKEDGYLLPLSFPDKYYGFSVEYMIPHGSYTNVENTEYDENNYNLLNLYEIKKAELNNLNDILSITFDESMLNATIQTNNINHYAVNDVIFIMNNFGILGINGQFNITEIISNTEFVITGNFSFDGNNIQYGFVTLKGIIKPNQTSDMSYSYPIPANYNASNNLDNPIEDYNILSRKFINSEYISDKQYIMSRIEGKDIIFRIRLRDENTGIYYERTAIAFNIISDDGLVHSIRFTLFDKGILIFRDYEYFGLINYYDLNLNNVTPLLAYQITKQQIVKAYEDTKNCVFNYISDLGDIYAKVHIGNLDPDTINWWDMFSGLGENLKCYINKINIFENITINDYNIGDKLTNENALTSELYLFEAIGDKSINYREFYEFNIPAIFYQKNLNNIVDFYGYQLPTEIDEFNRNIIKELALTNKTINDIDLFQNNYFINKKQDFFKRNDTFMYNAWFREIHSSYEYKLFNGDLNKLYNIYSQQILTYNSLRDFMGFIETKFRNVIMNFIPMVINISNFGNLITNNEYQLPKMRYNNKLCLGYDLNQNSYSVIKLFKNYIDDIGINENESFNFKIVIPKESIIFFEENYNWSFNRVATLNLISRDLKALFNSINLLQTYVDVYSEHLRISLNYDEIFNYFDNFNLEIYPNDFEILINDVIKYKFTLSNSSINDIKPEMINNCGIVLKDETKYSEDCGFINYSLPKPPSEEIYIYYKDEIIPSDVKQIFTYFKDENNNTKVTTRFKNEL